MQNPKISHFIHSGKRHLVRSSLTAAHPSIPLASLPYLFPLYNPSAVDVLLFWEIPAQRRSGHVLVSGLNLGAGHADLQGVIEEAESAKVKRSMYAETHRERIEVLEAIRNSEWNINVNPILVTLHDCEIVKHDFSTGCVLIISCIYSIIHDIEQSLLHPCHLFVTQLLPYASSAFHFPSRFRTRRISTILVSPLWTIASAY